MLARFVLVYQVTALGGGGARLGLAMEIGVLTNTWIG